MEFLLGNIPNVGIILFENQNVTYSNKTAGNILGTTDIGTCDVLTYSNATSDFALSKLFLRTSNSSVSVLNMLRSYSGNKQDSKFVVLQEKTCLQFEVVSNHSHTACYITVQRGIHTYSSTNGNFRGISLVAHTGRTLSFDDASTRIC